MDNDKNNDSTAEDDAHSENRSKASGDSATPQPHTYDNAATPADDTSNKRNAYLDNNAQQDGMLRSKEWKWKDKDDQDEKEEDGETKGDREEETDDQCSDCGLVETEKTDLPYSSEEADLNEGLSDSSQDISPDKEYLSGDEQLREEHIPLFKLHIARNLLKSERVSSFRSINELGQDHLSPIVEGEVMDFSREQTPVGSCHNIAHHLTVADESFLHNSQLSLGSYTERKNRRAGTMQNLHEHDSFLNLTTGENKVGKVMKRALIYLKDDISFGSLAALNTIAIRETEKDHLLDGGKPIYAVPSRNHTKNVLALSVSIALVFIALGSVRNLQSSINHEGGVGVLSMAVSFIGYMLGSIGSPTVVQIIQPKKCVIVGLIPHLLYVASNIYPTMWLLGLTSLLQGVALAIVWNAMSTYITLLSTGQAQMLDQDYSQVSSRYFGIFGLFFQSYFIVGNLIASLVLTNGDASSSDSDTHLSATNTTPSVIPNKPLNASLGTPLVQPSNQTAMSLSQNAISKESVDYLHLCGAKFWQHYDLGGGAYHVSLETKYLLFGTYMGCVVASIMIALCILEPLNPKLFQRSIKRSAQLKKQLHSLWRLWMSPRFLVIVPMLMYSFMEVGFVSAEVTKAFVTCPIGIHMVGYTMMCLGICGSLSSYISGIIITWVGRKAQLVFAAVANLAVLAFLRYWHPATDSYVPYFFIMGMWGISDGIWVAQINSLLCVNFTDAYEEAFAGLRMCQGIGVAIVFGSSQSLSMLTKIYFIGVWCVVAVTLYAIYDFYEQRKSQKQVEVEKILMRQTSV